MRYSPPAGGAYRIVTTSATTLTPGSKHAEAMGQWQSLPLRRMWEAVFGLALWHSGDSAACGCCTGRQGFATRLRGIDLLISVNDERRRCAQDCDLRDGVRPDV